jgi:hypothetical protein
MPSHYRFTLKMATAMFSEMDNFQHSTLLFPESQSYISMKFTITGARGEPMAICPFVSVEVEK